MQPTRLLSEADTFEVLVRYSASGTIDRQRDVELWSSQALFKENLDSRIEINVDIGNKVLANSE